MYIGIFKSIDVVYRVRAVQNGVLRSRVVF